MTLQDFKKKLSLLFDDNTDTVVWKNYVDYSIWAIILISTVAIFLSTYSDIYEKYGAILNVIDIITTILFTIEVSLRIWTIDILEPKYSGFWGRVKYCLSFYGLIDFVSTYSYYINFFIPLPLMVLKAIRVARLLRIFRFMKSFRLLTTAIGSKGKELLVSLQFLVIITIILSFVLFFAEHEAQPDVYDNGMTPVLWAFMQYIGDPGGFGDYPPVTVAGRIIACVIGILGIAIFAVPAGLIGAGFTEAMEEDEKEKTKEENIHKIHKAFKQVQCRYTKMLYVPKFISLVDIKSKQYLSEADIIDAVSSADDLRLRNIASARPIEERPEDKMVVETFPKNCDYGCFIDRGSNVTIVNTSNHAEAAIGSFSFYLAKMGGFNYISKEVEHPQGKGVSYYNINDENRCPNLKPFLADINKLANRENSWVIFLLSASGGQEPVYPTLFHYIIGGKKGEVNYEDPNLTIKDTASFQKAYEEINQKFQLNQWDSDIQKYHTGTSPKNIARHITAKNAFTVRIAWSITCFDYKSYEAAFNMAQSFKKHFAGGDLTAMPECLTTRNLDHDYGYLFYDEIEEHQFD